MSTHGNNVVCTKCGLQGALLNCSQCLRPFHLLCVPARTSRSGHRVLCADCQEPLDDGDVSMASISTALDRENLSISMAKITVKKQLLALQRERFLERAQPPAEEAAESQDQQAELPVPKFNLNGAMAASTSLLSGQIPGRVNTLTQIPDREVERSLDEQALQLRLEELELQAEDVRLRSIQMRGGVATPTRAPSVAQIPVNQVQQRTEAWVRNSCVSVEDVESMPLPAPPPPSASLSNPNRGVAAERLAERLVERLADGGAIGRHNTAVMSARVRGSVGGTVQAAPQVDEGIGTPGDESQHRQHLGNRSWVLEGIEIPDHVQLTKTQALRRTGGIPPLPLLEGKSRTEWIDFLRAIVHDTAAYGLSHYENWQRVRDCLKGESALACKGWLVFPEQFSDAFKRLVDVFGSPNKLMGDAVDTLTALPPLSPDYSNLAMYTSEITYTLAVMEIAGESTRNATLLMILERKLPMKLAMRWAEKKSRATTLTEFQQFLDKILIAALKANVKVLPTEPEKKRVVAQKHPIMTVSEMPPPKPVVHEEMARKSKEPVSKAPVSPTKCPIGCADVHTCAKCPVFEAKSVEDRKSMCVAEKLCFQCLKSHRFGMCRSPRCGVNDCRGRHHRLLHVPVPCPPPNARQATTTGRKPAPIMVTGEKWNNVKPLYKIVAVRLAYNGAMVETYAVIDACASVTLLSHKVKSQLNIPDPDTSMELSWICNKEITVSVRRVAIEISGEDGVWHHISGNAGVDVTEILHPYTVSRQDLDRLGATAKVPVLENVQPEILIGLDNGHICCHYLEMLNTHDPNVVMVKTKLGWTLNGGMNSLPEKARVMLIRDVVMHKMVKDYINTDLVGVVEDSRAYSVDDTNVLAKLSREVVKIDGRFQCPMLWKDERRVVPDSKSMAKKRFLTFDKKMRSNPVMAEKLQKLMQHYLDVEFARVVEDGNEDENANFLPVFTVSNAQKPDKVRLVWDAAAKSRGVSLNDLLVSGPDLTEPLVYVLQRFRQGPVAVMGDVAEMYLQVAVPPEDRAALRFLWRFTDGIVRVVEMCGHIFGATCSPTCAQYVKNLNADSFKEEFPEAARSLRNNVYVDDWAVSRWTVAEALTITKDVIHIMNSAGFPLHKWCTNSRELAAQLDGNDEARQVIRFQESKILGMRWSVAEDVFLFDIEMGKFRRYHEDAPTKRQVLSLVMSIFDPLGLVSFMTIAPKLLLRELWRRDVEWDKPIPEECMQPWRTWTELLPAIQDLRFPRWYGTRNDAVEVHVFADASERAIAAVAYIIQRNEGADPVCSLVASKCKLAHLHGRSIPRQELDAFLLGVKLLGIVTKGLELPISCSRVWTDSHDVLYWLTSTARRYKPFVMARVNTIRSATKTDQWRYVPSDQNPADWATKMIDFTGGVSLWTDGPSFLRDSADSWPRWSPFRPTEATAEEIENVFLTSSPDPLVSCIARISKWKVGVRAVALVMVFCKKLKARVTARRTRSTTAARVKQLGVKHIDILTPADEMIAERLLIQRAQTALNKKDLLRLSAYIHEDGCVRMSSRIAKASKVSFEIRYPIILPQRHEITRRIFDHWHRLTGHDCNDRALLAIRKNGFICVGMRRQLNEVTRQCNMCRVRRTTVQHPLMGLLPTARLGVGERPFTFTGCDLFGPLNVAVGRRHEKRWGVIFVCMTVRAIHLECVSSLSARSFCMALDRFVARRGVMPREIRCDNGTNFVAASKTYSWNGRRPVWKFNPPAAPHTGGAWERLVGLVKKAMAGIRTTNTPSDEELQHLLGCAEGIVNSRPLTQIPMDPKEELPITPSDILYGRPDVDRDVIIPRTISEMSLDREVFVLEFWRRWTHEYLPSISARPKWQRAVLPLKIGDLVLLAEGDRMGWRRGIVEEVLEDDRTNQVREVVVKTADGVLYRRHASGVAPIRLFESKVDADLPRTSTKKGEIVD